MISYTINFNKMNTLNESTLNRIVEHIGKYDIGIITAFRGMFRDETASTLDDRSSEYRRDSWGEDYTYTKGQNRDRNRNLKAVLLHLGYGVTKIKGVYVEGYKGSNPFEVFEESLFVVNLNNDEDFFNNLKKLAEYYNQDSFIFKDMEADDAILVGTNNAEFPGFGNIEKLGTLHLNVDVEFLSRLKNRTFSFTDETNLQHKEIVSDYFRGRKKAINDMNKPIQESSNEYTSIQTYSDLSGQQRMAVRAIAKKVLSDMNK